MHVTLTALWLGLAPTAVALAAAIPLSRRPLQRWPGLGRLLRRLASVLIAAAALTGGTLAGLALAYGAQPHTVSELTVSLALYAGATACALACEWYVSTPERSRAERLRLILLASVVCVTAAGARAGLKGRNLVVATLAVGFSVVAALAVSYAVVAARGVRSRLRTARLSGLRGIITRVRAPRLAIRLTRRGWILLIGVAAVAGFGLVAATPRGATAVQAIEVGALVGAGGYVAALHALARRWSPDRARPTDSTGAAGWLLMPAAAAIGGFVTLELGQRWTATLVASMLLLDAMTLWLGARDRAGV